jgi:CHASE2 domain-containing sensor protein
MPAVQGSLLQYRFWVQAVYRQLTDQKGGSASPPILVVQVDRESLRRDHVNPVSPILNRRYLARLVTRLQQWQPPVLGFNYYFDRPQGKRDRQLFQTLKQLTSHHPTRVVVPITLEHPEDANSWLLPLPEMIDPQQS